MHYVSEIFIHLFIAPMIVVMQQREKNEKIL